MEKYDYKKISYTALVIVLVAVGILVFIHNTGVVEPEQQQSGTLSIERTVSTAPMHREPYVARDRSRFHGTLGRGADAIREALHTTTDAADMNQEIQRLFMEAWHVAKSTGNFDLIEEVFLAVEQKQRYGLATMLPMVFSRLGPEHDIPEKLGILENLSDIKSSLDTLERQIYQAEAKERYDEMQKAGMIGELAPEDFAAVIQAVGGVRLGKAFERINDGGTEEARRMAARALGRFAMRAGTMEGSEEIAKLAPGIVRDEAVAEMVIWMNKTGSKDEATPWLEAIQDPAAKARATLKPKPKKTPAAGNAADAGTSKPGAE